jgi:hypothetical protein
MWWLRPPASQPTTGFIGRIVGGGREDVVHAVVELAAARGKISGVDRCGWSGRPAIRQADDQMDQHERRTATSQRRLTQQHHRQNEHVGEVERLAREQDGVLARRMPVRFQIVVGGEEKGLKVPHKNVIEREHRVKKQRIDVLEAVPDGARLVGRKAEDAAAVSASSSPCRLMQEWWPRWCRMRHM